MLGVTTLVAAFIASVSATTPSGSPVPTTPSGRLLVTTTAQCNRSAQAARACEFCAQYIASLPTAADPFSLGSPAVQRFCSALLTRGDILVAGFDFTPVPGVTPGAPGAAGPGTPSGPGGATTPSPPPPTPIQQIADAISTGEVSQAAIQPIPGQSANAAADGGTNIATQGAFNGAGVSNFDANADATSVGGSAPAAVQQNVFTASQIEGDQSASVLTFEQATANGVSAGDGVDFTGDVTATNQGTGPGAAGGTGTATISGEVTGANTVQTGTITAGSDSSTVPTSTSTTTP